jgi:hypothetical protein
MVTYSKEEKQAIMEEYKTSGKILWEYTEKKEYQQVHCKDGLKKIRT